MKLAVPSTAWAGFARAATGFELVVWLAPSKPLVPDGAPEPVLVPVPAVLPVPLVAAALSELFAVTLAVLLCVPVWVPLCVPLGHFFELPLYACTSRPQILCGWLFPGPKTGVPEGAPLPFAICAAVLPLPYSFDESALFGYVLDWQVAELPCPPPVVHV